MSFMKLKAAVAVVAGLSATVAVVAHYELPMFGAHGLLHPSKRTVDPQPTVWSEIDGWIEFVWKGRDC